MGELYGTDFVLWTEEQTRALREAGRPGSNLVVDWENVAEEIESLGRSDRRAVASRIRTILEQLLKPEVSPAENPTQGRRETVRRARVEIEDLLQDGPSLRRELAAMIQQELAPARELVHAALEDHGEVPRRKLKLEEVTFVEEQVLGN